MSLILGPEFIQADFCSVSDELFGDLPALSTFCSLASGPLNITAKRNGPAHLLTRFRLVIRKPSGADLPLRSTHGGFRARFRRIFVAAIPYSASPRPHKDPDKTTTDRLRRNDITAIWRRTVSSMSRVPTTTKVLM